MMMVPVTPVAMAKSTRGVEIASAGDIDNAQVMAWMQQITAMQAGNTGNEYLLIACYVFAAIQYLVDVLPYVFDVIVVFAGIRLLRSLVLDRFSSTTVLEAARLSRLCGTMPPPG